MSESAQPIPFPRRLLHQSPQLRLDYFKAYTVAHPALKQADQAVWNALREPSGASLVFVFGPTGVGKTTLLAQIEKRLMDLSFSGEHQGKNHLPALRLDAVSPALNLFKWSDYYQRALMLLREARVEYTVDYSHNFPLMTKGRIEQEPVSWKGSTDTAALRLAFEQALKRRRPHAILIDEAEHIAKAARGAKLLDQLDHLKSLAIMSQTVHVLVGTYDLMVFRNLSAQLSRRSIDVHFSRYRVTHESETRAFKSVLWSFQRNLPLEEEPDLLQHWKYCYERTIGCVGVLKDWLTRALAEALERGESTLSRPLLEQHALSVDRCNQMVTESVAGESALKEDDHAAYRLRVRLGLEAGPASQQEGGSQKKEAFTGSGSAQQHARRVGQRRPYRDPVKDESAS
jgi:energy-coupling factor transporter ATP-binding protein EcfA2